MTPEEREAVYRKLCLQALWRRDPLAASIVERLWSQGREQPPTDQGRARGPAAGAASAGRARSGPARREE